MKKLFCLFWVCVCALFLSGAGAEPLRLEGLELLGCVQDEAGNTCLTGRPWGPGLHGGRVICLSPAGELLWQAEPEGILYSIAPLPGGLLAGLRRTEDGAELWLLREGQVVATHAVDSQCLRLHPAAGGILLECGGRETRLMLLDEQLQPRWQLSLGGDVTLTGVISRPEGIYAAGYLYRDSNACAEAVLLRIAPDGQGFEVVDRITNARFTALAADSSGLTLAMDTEPDFGFAESRLLRYSPEGQLWRREISYGENREGSLHAVTAAGDGWLAVASRRKEHGQVLLLTVAADGSLLRETICPVDGLGPVTACRLLPVDGGALMVVCGRDAAQFGVYHTVVMKVEGE